jgi:site-specific DNA-methyltransferase (adenine-specific)/adenine-specific DNA-methyltransferase
MLTAGLYDLSKVFSLSENDYISFVMDLFDVSPLKGAQINGIRVEGKKRDKFVKIYPYWEPEMRDADINEEYINELHQNIGANIKESFYLIAPATTVAFINDYYEIDGVRYYFLKIPYHVIQELHNKDFKKVRQPQSKNQVNSLDEAIGFHFIRQPQVESSFDSVKNQIIVSEFYSDYDYDDSSNFENLSMILVDYNLDGNFVMDDYFFVDELQKDAKKNNKKVLSIPLKDTGETVALVYVDVYGNEFREEINR